MTTQIPHAAERLINENVEFAELEHPNTTVYFGWLASLLADPYLSWILPDKWSLPTAADRCKARMPEAIIVPLFLDLANQKQDPGVGPVGSAPGSFAALIRNRSSFRSAGSRQDPRAPEMWTTSSLYGRFLIRDRQFHGPIS
jgi:hypothetical protein